MLPFKPTPEGNIHDTTSTVHQQNQQNQTRPVWLLNIPNFNNSEEEPENVVSTLLTCRFLFLDSMRWKSDVLRFQQTNAHYDIRYSVDVYGIKS